ncbi:MAG: TRAP transporter small permease subunit [Minwuia sp.]|uniref:TRAP transporter small permease subunit n=1 Tax=Minwuia sp. TaxID=2493630 RepID=UPI003A86A904
MLNLADGLATISNRVGRGVSWLILPLIFIIMFDVITRKIEYIATWSADITIEYGYSVSFILQDLQWHIHGVLLMLTFGMGYLANAHVRVDIFREMGARRTQCWIEFIGLVFLAIPFLIFALVYSIDMVTLSYHQGEGSESLVGIPWRYVIKSVLPIGFLILLFAAVATLIRVATFLFGSDQSRSRAEENIQFFTDIAVLPKASLDNADDVIAVDGEPR